MAFMRTALQDTITTGDYAHAEPMISSCRRRSHEANRLALGSRCDNSRRTVWDTHGLPSGHPEGSAEIGAPFDPARTPGIPAAVVHAKTVASAYRLRQAYTADDSMAFFPAEALIQLYYVVGDIRN